MMTDWSFLVLFLDNPSATVPRTKEEFREGRQSTITCTLRKAPAGSRVTWYKDGRVLNTGAGGYRGGTLQQPSLTIVQPGDQHEGVYVCSVDVFGVTANSSAVTVEVQCTCFWRRCPLS